MLANGTPLPGRTGRRLHDLLRSLPSVHELLPTYACLVEGTTRRPLADVRPAAVGGALFDEACGFWAETDDATARLAGGVDTMAVVGQYQATPTLARVRDGTVEVLEDLVWSGEGDAVLGGGDGTVPRGASQPQEWGTRVAGAHLNAARHINLAQSSRVRAEVEGAIRGTQYLTLGEEGGFGISVPAVVVAGEALAVEARHHDDHLALKATVSDLERDSSRSPVPLRNLGGSRYGTSIRGLDPGAYEVVVHGVADGGPRRVSDVTIVVPAELP